MQRFGGLVVALFAALWLVTAAPSGVSACTSCPVTFEEFVKGNDRIVLARYAGHSGGWFLFRVDDVLKGTSPRTLRFKYQPWETRHARIGSRWLMTTDIPPDGVPRASFVLRVSPRGAVEADEGEGSVLTPDTLAGWYQAIARLLPETATDASGSRPTESPNLPVPLFAAAALFGLVVTLRRLGADAPGRRLRRRGGTPA